MFPLSLTGTAFN
jgi:hypothetical protein